jgi:hypothetical protein
MPLVSLAGFVPRDTQESNIHTRSCELLLALHALGICQEWRCFPAALLRENMKEFLKYCYCSVARVFQTILYTLGTRYCVYVCLEEERFFLLFGV